MKSFLVAVVLFAAVAYAAPKNKRDVSHLNDESEGYHYPVPQPSVNREYLTPKASEPEEQIAEGYQYPVPQASVNNRYLAPAEPQEPAATLISEERLASNQPEPAPQKEYLSPESSVNREYLAPKNKRDVSHLNHHDESEGYQYPAPQASVNRQYVAPQASVNRQYVAPQASVNRQYLAPQASVNRQYLAPQPSVNPQYPAPQASVNNQYFAPQPSVNKMYLAPIDEAMSAPAPINIAAPSEKQLIFDAPEQDSVIVESVARSSDEHQQQVGSNGGYVY